MPVLQKEPLLYPRVFILQLQNHMQFQWSCDDKKRVWREAVGAELDKRAKGPENQMQVTSRVNC